MERRIERQGEERHTYLPKTTMQIKPIAAIEQMVTTIVMSVEESEKPEKPMR